MEKKKELYSHGIKMQWAGVILFLASQLLNQFLFAIPSISLFVLACGSMVMICYGMILCRTKTSGGSYDEESKKI